MKIDKIIFSSDDSIFLEFWPIQAKICREVLGIDPVLFYITEEDSDFYQDGNGLVKKIKKAPNIYNLGAQAAISRMYFTRYFPEEVCLVSDLDLITINKDYIFSQIEKIDENSLVIFDSDAYDLSRPESREYLENPYFPYVQELYPYHFNAAKGKTFDKILGTNCSHEEYLRKHQGIGDGSVFWGVDEFYFSECVNSRNHGIEIHKLKRGFYTNFFCPGRIERHNFPCSLEDPNEIQNQEIHGVYKIEDLLSGKYIDCNLPRPYSKYKKEIDFLVDTIIELKNKKMEQTFFELGKKFGTDKIDHHRYDRFYPTFLEKFRNDEIKIFEIGCGKDASSFWMWHEYFPKGKIYCMDISEEIISDRGEVFKGDQSREEDLNKAYDKIGKCQIIIDDGSHVPRHQILTFETLFKEMLDEGGVYIIEDIECSYWNPEKYIYGYQVGGQSIVDYFSSVSHKVNSEFSGQKNPWGISTITFAHNCIIITKKTSEEEDLTSRDYRFNFML